MTQTVTQLEITTQALRTRHSDLGVSKLEKLVFVQITSHIRADYSKGYWCNPSLRLLADETGMTAATVAKCVEALVVAKLVKVDATREKHNNIYWINGAAVVEAHEKWVESFRGRVPEESTSSFGTVAKIQKEVYRDKQSKTSEHERNTSGLKQNTQKPSPQYADELDQDAPF